MPAFANIDGETLTQCQLHVPNVGPWWADCWFELAPDISGQVTLTVGDLVLSGTVKEGGIFAQQTRVRVVAGAAGWGSLIASRHYHNDSGVRAQTIASDAARLSGESIGAFSVDSDTVGVDYVRESGRASRSLEDAINGAPWHVGYDGVTNIGARDSEPVSDELYQVLDFDTQNRTAVLSMDDLSSVVVGSVLSEGLANSETVRELRVSVDSGSSRVFVWFGGDDSSRGRLASALSGILSKATSAQLFAKYKYRLVNMSGERTELQAVSVVSGLPDVLPVSMQPGVAGAHAKLTPGSIVLVEFVEGDRTQPIVVAFAGKDTTGHVTGELDFSVTTTLRLGSDAATEGVPLGDALKSWLDGHTHSYIDTVTGTPTPTLTSIPTTAPAVPPAPAILDPSPNPSQKVKVDS